MSETTTVVRRGKTPEQMREYKRLKAIEYRKNAKKAAVAAAAPPPPPAPVPPSSASVIIPDDVKATIAKLQVPYQLRFTNLYDKWQKGKASRSEVKELEKAEIINQVTTQEVDEITGAKQGVADWISTEYHALAGLTRRTVSNWIRGVHLPPGCHEPYPAPLGGRHLKSLGRQWLERYVVDSKSVNGDSVDKSRFLSPTERQEAAEADVAEMERDDLKRKMDRDWMMAAAHEFTMASVGTVARNTVRDAMEKLLPDEMERALTELVPDADLRARILARLRTVAAAGTDEWQATFCRRLASLDEECQKNSMEEKEKR
jgi:hypothetical protein